jgi:hypothetical protein
MCNAFIRVDHKDQRHQRSIKERPKFQISSLKFQGVQMTPLGSWYLGLETWALLYLCEILCAKKSKPQKEKVIGH